MRLRYLEIVLQEPKQPKCQIAMSFANALAGFVVTFNVTAVFLRNREGERAWINIHVGFPVRNIGDGQGANQRVEVRRIVTASRLEDLRSGETPGLEVIEI